MNLFEIITSLERNEDIHLARILILLNEFAENGKAIEGLTKLAKLDFLLRYPVYLEKALQARGRTGKDVGLKNYERTSVESKMVRYKYGPWDFRYRKFINVLIAKGLAYHIIDGKTVNIGLTAKGIELVKSLNAHSDYEDIAKRAKIIRNQFDYGGTYLKDFVYRVFPEIGTLNLRTEIK